MSGTGFINFQTHFISTTIPCISESIFFDTSFGIGFGYLLEKQEDGSWTVKKTINTFMT
ncbi:hypothetical protein [uncultured Chryseobacterium sp.]|uniref:hypothetical protein n=1 Tax=uncultured Chryseobacterium sp. TaxID=259322 RepID=UPI0025FA7089|nr:hypothetical protein [uncultured Chryseobacterium sp.]